MRLVGAILATVSGLVILGYVSYVLILSQEVHLALKIAIPGVAAGLLLLLASVLRERLKAHEREGLDEVEP